jgi:hypothetical protein
MAIRCGRLSRRPRQPCPGHATLQRATPSTSSSSAKPLPRKALSSTTRPMDGSSYFKPGSTTRR